MTKSIDCEIWIAMNEDGDWSVSVDEDDALPELATQQGGYAARVVKITVTMSAPVITEASVTVPDDARDTVQTEVSAS